MTNYNKVILIVLFIIKMMIIQLFKVSFFFDCISNNLDKNTWWTQCALQHIFASKEWKQLHIQKVYFWMNDNPIHFQAYEFQYSLWNLTQQQSSLTFTCKWNYFVEGHGKSICASHSSKVSLALSLWSKQQDHVIDGTHIAMQAISDMFFFWKS